MSALARPMLEDAAEAVFQRIYIYGNAYDGTGCPRSFTLKRMGRNREREWTARWGDSCGHDAGALEATHESATGAVLELLKILEREAMGDV